MFVRPAAFRRASGSEDPPPTQESPDGLTRAEAHALSRCAPLSPAEFKERRRVADQGLVSLRGVLADDNGARRR